MHTSTQGQAKKKNQDGVGLTSGSHNMKFNKNLNKKDEENQA